MAAYRVLWLVPEILMGSMSWFLRYNPSTTNTNSKFQQRGMWFMFSKTAN